MTVAAKQAETLVCEDCGVDLTTKDAAWCSDCSQASADQAAENAITEECESAKKLAAQLIRARADRGRLMGILRPDVVAELEEVAADVEHGT